MLDTIQEKFSESEDRIRDFVGRDSADGENAEIGKTESLIAFGSAIAATFIVRKLLQASWRTAFDCEPPKNPASREVDWKDALMWGAISGAVVGMARIGSRRLGSSAYQNISDRY